MANTIQSAPAQQKKHVSNQEFVLFLISVFFYTNMTGMVNGYRQAYLVNVLRLDSGSVSLINAICGILGFALSFFYAIIMDNRKKSKLGKFRPLGLASAVPMGILTVMMFVTPQMPLPIMIAYLCTVQLLQGAASYFGNSVNMVGVVMTPNTQERDKILSFRGISSAIGNSAPLVIVLVIGLLRKPGIIQTEAMMYIVSAALCGLVGTLSMLAGMKAVRERIVYSEKRENPLLGFRDVIGNKYAILVLISEFLKNFRQIANYMGIFLAVALLGDPSKFILFGLPTGIGTFVGMLIVNALLKKFTSKQIYIASGVYSVLANGAAFATGILCFNHPEQSSLTVLFVVCLFLIGLQFGASNLLPSMFQADILEDIELKTGKRLDASLGFIISAGSSLSGLIAQSLPPRILYGDHSIIQYIQPVDQMVDGVMQTVYQTQAYDTKVKLLFFYTLFHGMMMLLAGLPFFLYKLTGKERDRVHEEVLRRREALGEELGVTKGEEEAR